MRTRKHFTLIDASLHTLKHLSLPKTFNPLNKRLKTPKTTVSNGKRVWRTNLKGPEDKPELLLQAGKRQTVGHAVGGSKSWAKKSTLAVVLALKRRNCNNGRILLKKKKSWQKLPSSLKSEGFEMYWFQQKLLQKYVFSAKYLIGLKRQHTTSGERLLGFDE